MTDRELLERAAKAAGYDALAEMYGWDDVTGSVLLDANDPPGLWNPLADDGDALRLAVKLGLWVASDNELGQSFVADDPECGGRVALVEWHSAGGNLAATRRAITRAAAAMPGDDGDDGGVR